MSQEIRILQLADRDAILQYERQKLSVTQPDEFERQMLEWHASWRAEALEHYLPLGWSFGIWVDGSIQGYFLGQTQVFTRGLTQTLWVERVQFDSKSLLVTLLEVAYKLCREKHFQQLLVLKSPALDAVLAEKDFGPYSDLLAKVEDQSESAYQMKTSRI